MRSFLDVLRTIPINALVRHVQFVFGGYNKPMLKIKIAA
jgi:hypothetical protein